MPDDPRENASEPEPDGNFLFPALFAAGPMEELEALAQRKLRMYSSLGDRANAERLTAALELARTRLGAILSQPRMTKGS